MFQDRADAGRRLAARLAAVHLDPTSLTVLALPRGGVPVGFEIAQALGAPLEVLVVRKLGAPTQPELGLGAVAPGVKVLNERLISQLGVSSEYLDEIVRRETQEMTRRSALYRQGLPALELGGVTALLVDDGLATGVTARAAARSARLQGAASVILAVPVCAAQTTHALRAEVDHLIALSTPRNFEAVGLWYHTFEQTTDQQVIELLRLAQGENSQANAHS